jgi:hypothetical protein
MHIRDNGQAKEKEKDLPQHLQAHPKEIKIKKISK